MRDYDIRSAMTEHALARHLQDPDTLVVHEFGLRHGHVRVDIAVVNGSIHGFEIKSDRDTLHRLDRQIEAYNSVLDYATIVVGERHADKAMSALPDWWGAMIARPAAAGGIRLSNLRKARRNPTQNPLAIAELLWKDEVACALEQLGFTPKSLRRPRRELYAELAGAVSPTRLRSLVRSALKNRTNWRDLPMPG